MLWLQRGDRLPTVAWLQNALNSDAQNEVALAVDGDYGQKTYECVKTFQKRRRLPIDGVVGPKTCKEIMSLTSDMIINYVDDADAKRKGESFGQAALRCLTKLGADFIPSVASQDGRQLILDGLARRKARGKVALLRIYGHAIAGSQSLTVGLGVTKEYVGGRFDFRGGKFVGGREVNVPLGDNHGRSLYDGNMAEATFFVTQLSKYFAPLGSLELHGCQNAQGRQGKSFIARLAMIGGFPVTGSIPDNFVEAGSPKTTMRLSKPTYTFFPLAMELKTWARGRLTPSALLV